MSSEVGVLSLLGTALLLGVRHGVDWDHVAAILDIAGSAAGDAGRSTPSRLRTLWLASLYAVGHGLVVVLLGLVALAFKAALPEWIDPIMERVVGVTLLVLGVWVLVSLARFLRGEGEFRLQSRWMVVFAAVRHALLHLRHRHHHRDGRGTFRVDAYGPRAALGVGMLHGIGAETGTQVLLFAAVGGVANQGVGLGMLLAFVVGLVCSNAFVAVLAASGFITSMAARPVFVAIGALTGLFSLVVGTYFVLGLSDTLPDPAEWLPFLSPGAE